MREGIEGVFLSFVKKPEKIRIQAKHILLPIIFNL
jgi:hypothetical protein